MIGILKKGSSSPKRNNFAKFRAGILEFST